jgi:hypothetical protein
MQAVKQSYIMSFHNTAEAAGSRDCISNSTNYKTLFAMVQSYLGKDSRFQSEENTADQQQAGSCGTRIFAGKVLEEGFRDLEDITMTELLKLYNNQDINVVNIQKTGFSGAMQNLVQGKASRF